MTDEPDEPDDTQVNRVDPTVRQPATRGFSAPDGEADGGGGGEGRDSPEGAEAPVEKHSALVGWMSVPVHQRLPIRRSTLLMIILFLGFGTLCYLYPPNSAAITCNPSRTCFDSAGNEVGTLPATSTTTSTTAPTTTSTTIRPTTSTTSGAHTGVSTSTTAAGQPAPTTTAPTTQSTTTTQPGTSGSTTTSSAPGGSGTGTTTTAPRP
jgi:hypothetical protein